METYSPFKIDDFWNDCINNNKEKNSPLKYDKKSYYYRKKNNIKLKTIKTNNQKIMRNPKKNNIGKNKTTIYFSAVDKIYKRLNTKYPELFRNKQNNKIHKRIENSLLKSKILYEEGLEKKKLVEKNMEENNKNKLYKELSLCTFRPKISRRKNEDEYIQPFYKKIYEREFVPFQKCKRCNKSAEIMKKNDLINVSTEIEKKSKEKYNKSKRKKSNKSLIIDKEEAEFILRYTKARDEKIIKIIKKLYKKDDSYDYYLNTLTSRVGNREYKNSLNVNNSIPLYGETVSRNNYINSTTSQIGEFKGLSFNEEAKIKQSKKNKRLIMNEIRKGLMEINLRDEI
jgi:hypothetical protein